MDDDPADAVFRTDVVDVFVVLEYTGDMFVLVVNLDLLYLCCIQVIGIAVFGIAVPYFIEVGHFYPFNLFGRYFRGELFESAN